MTTLSHHPFCDYNVIVNEADQALLEAVETARGDVTVTGRAAVVRKLMFVLGLSCGGSVVGMANQRRELFRDLDDRIIAEMFTTAPATEFAAPMATVTFFHAARSPEDK